MPRLARLLAGLALATIPMLAAAVEPLSVRVEGNVEVEKAELAAGPDLAFNAALVEAALEVAREMVPPERMEAEEERLREVFARRAPGFVLTYRVEAREGPLLSPDNALKQVFSASLHVTLDAALVREALAALGMLQGWNQPSIVTRVVRTDLDPGAPGVPLEPFGQFIARRLETEGFVLIDPMARGEVASDAVGSVLDLGRELGADLAVEFGVRWRPRPSVSDLAAGTTEVRVLALRVRDGSEIARAHFEGPAYHQDPDEAFARGLEAVQDQVVENLVLQLGRNWNALAKQDGPIQLRLLNVSSLHQVEMVQRSLRRQLGAREAVLSGLAPAIAELEVRGSLSPGALHDRLIGLTFEHFQLFPVGVSRQLVEVRVQALAEPASDAR